MKPTTIHIVLSLVITHGWVIRQLDAQNAFLHGGLHEKVYFAHLNYLHHACRLNKSLYGLNEAP